MVSTTCQIAAAISLVLFVSIVVPGAEALKCYICNSKYNGTGCLSPPHKDFIRDCPTINGQPAILCRTMFITMGTEEPTVDRRCGAAKQHKECLNTATFQIKSTTCQCETDACNPATASAPTMMLVALSAIVGVALCRSA
ncbi:uncharacterized protein LOC100898800 [Galendromus occidentalis]|uniref:Uncharacterized protein LOC100898800 n=1 Tax=Galendromus occidentalis TaxID=34638 RepID=A0AAJ6VZY4_9ACAR|nr:uncharacterized protein LOC100898800 [Galendromus occidentalis]XP_003747289.1 uncharacterized protein LOC100898800 [Galendromus occidentalis]